MEQLSFASLDYQAKKKRTKREKFLAEMDRVIPWSRLEALIEPHYPKAGNGRRPYPLGTMLRIYWSTSTAPTPRKKVPGRPWKPGQSGNPSGRPAKDARIVKLADNWTEKSVDTLVEIMSDPEARNSDRRECARLLLAYAHGHPRAMREVELNATLSVTDHLDLQLSALVCIKMASPY